MQTDYKKLAKMYAMNDTTDRANRGVKLSAWIMAAVFSGVVWGLIYFCVKSF